MPSNSIRRVLLVLAILVVSGIARMPIEQALTRELRQQEMLSEPLELETRKKVGQGFWAVSLGGLRTLVATILNLRAFSYFEKHQWEQLADTYDTIVELAPNSRYYWDTGSWHMAYNAAAYQLNYSTQPELRMRSDWRHWILKGTAFLEEGCRQNPDDWKLWSQLGWLYADPNKLVDYEKAANAYRQAVASGNALPYVARAEAYALARVPGREDEALELVRKLNDDPRGKLPTLTCIRFALESRDDPEQDSDALMLKVFGDDEQAYRLLSNYYLGIRDNFPMNGVAPALRKLEARLMVPEDQSIFKAREELEDQ